MKQRGYADAFIDGVLVGLDPLGTGIGYASYTMGKPVPAYRFVGFTADYSGPGRSHDSGGAPPQPLSRSYGEQAIKGIGDAVGLVVNVIAVGMAQLVMLTTDFDRPR